MSVSSDVDGLYERSKEEYPKVTKLSIEKIVEMRNLFGKYGGRLSSRIYEEEGTVLFRPNKRKGEGYAIRFGHERPLQLIAPEGVYSMFWGRGDFDEYGHRRPLGSSFIDVDNLDKFLIALEVRYNIPGSLRTHEKECDTSAKVQEEGGPKTEKYLTVPFSGIVKI